ncbi:hypothetical protein NMY22_g4131 [Coprinellus aureogranulatus]|nr:hypothetical protein NMY22_g4131 [Coprinellus aureogranulatus]
MKSPDSKATEAVVASATNRPHERAMEDTTGVFFILLMTELSVPRFKFNVKARIGNPPEIKFTYTTSDA